MGLNIDASAYDPTVAQSIQDAFRGAFVISPVLLIPIIVVIVMCILRVPGLVGIAISVATATIFMMIFQPTSIYGSRALGDIFNMLHYGIGVETGNEVADSILGKAGGMDGTMWTINLILLALAYGGALERCGCVERLFGGLKHKIHSVGSLILATLLTSIFCDATMCDQFLGIGVPAPSMLTSTTSSVSAAICSPVLWKMPVPSGPLCSPGPAAALTSMAFSA